MGDKGSTVIDPNTLLSPEDKAAKVYQAIRDGDLDTIAAMALSTDGLLSDDIRREVWPLFLGYADFTADGIKLHNVTRPDWETLPPHKDEDQVRLDVERSFVYYPKNMSPRETTERKKELSRVIIEVLRRHPMLCYFQGFHDICQVFLLVLGVEDAVIATEHIALLRIRDFMLPSLAPALDHLHLLYPLLLSADKPLCEHLSRTRPFFALAATLTLYAHDIQEYSNIARLFDVFLATDPVFPLYLFAQVVLQRRDELFDIPDDEPEMLHSVLSKLPKPLDLEGLINKALMLLEKFPPENLSTWRQISNKSVLKTSRRSGVILKGQTKRISGDLQEAEQLLLKQISEIERKKKIDKLCEQIAKYKPQIVTIGAAVIVGIGAVAVVALRKNGYTLALPELVNPVGLVKSVFGIFRRT
ncbi:rab-GTPase-TBC domain-containing protein [Kalaharituber pfeilii]|nr:rab-GTPase-TBC domain-containing protein [Kalaharituber pfeilii]